MSSNDLEDRERDVRTKKMIQVVGSHQLLKFQKQVKNVVSWWPEGIK
jgi:hypothetical protein